MSELGSSRPDQVLSDWPSASPPGCGVVRGGAAPRWQRHLPVSFENCWRGYVASRRDSSKKVKCGTMAQTAEQPLPSGGSAVDGFLEVLRLNTLGRVVSDARHDWAL